MNDAGIRTDRLNRDSLDSALRGAIKDAVRQNRLGELLLAVEEDEKVAAIHPDIRRWRARTGFGLGSIPADRRPTTFYTRPQSKPSAGDGRKRSSESDNSRFNRDSSKKQPEKRRRRVPKTRISFLVEDQHGEESHPARQDDVAKESHSESSVQETSNSSENEVPKKSGSTVPVMATLLLLAAAAILVFLVATQWDRLRDGQNERDSSTAEADDAGSARQAEMTSDAGPSSGEHRRTTAVSPSPTALDGGRGAPAPAPSPDSPLPPALSVSGSSCIGQWTSRRDQRGLSLSLTVHESQPDPSERHLPQWGLLRHRRYDGTLDRVQRSRYLRRCTNPRLDRLTCKIDGRDAELRCGEVNATLVYDEMTYTLNRG